uniref:Uncharacterized protein n=1 Tax=Hyaloperonospora arabidopsidis (strain Emoy2) TaxID=559515 RepID=M4C209_HYAAE
MGLNDDWCTGRRRVRLLDATVGSSKKRWESAFDFVAAMGLGGTASRYCVLRTYKLVRCSADA